MVKEFLSQYGVAFTVRNVVTDEDARRDFQAAGFLLPPVTVIHGVAVPGFQPDVLLSLLEASPTTSDSSNRTSEEPRAKNDNESHR